MTVPHIQWAKFGSLIWEDLHGVPGAVLAAAEAGLAVTPGDPQLQLDACLAALAAGEPKRALRLLDPSNLSARSTEGLTAWAWQLDDHWYPGGVSGGSAPPAEGMFVDAKAGPATEELIEQLVDNGPTGLLNTRTLLERSLRDGQLVGVYQATKLAFDHLQELGGYADLRGMPQLGIWAALAGADIMHRAGRDDAGSLLDVAR